MGQRVPIRVRPAKPGEPARAAPGQRAAAPGADLEAGAARPRYLDHRVDRHAGAAANAPWTVADADADAAAPTRPADAAPPVPAAVSPPPKPVPAPAPAPGPRQPPAPVVAPARDKDGAEAGTKDGAKDGDKEGTKDGKDGKDGAASQGGGAGRAPEDGADATTAAAPLPVDAGNAAETLAVALPALVWTPLAPSWAAPESLPSSELALPGRGPGAPPAAASAGPAAAEREQQRAPALVADAAHAYQELVRAAQREQGGFVAETNQVANYMAQQYGLVGGEIVHGHDEALGELDRSAEAARARAQAAAAWAQLRLDNAAANAGVGIAAAAGSAYGLIDADDRSAAQRIGAVVADLVGGHQKAYAGIIDGTKKAADAAALKQAAYRDGVAKNYAIGVADAMEGARNETLQHRVPKWVEQDATRTKKSVDDKTKTWTTSCEASVCSLGCGFRESLESERVAANAEGRSAVGRTTAQARRQVKAQAAAGRTALAGIARARLGQIDAQHRANRTRLSAQARGALAGLRGEAQGAVGGVLGAGRSALPGYARAALGASQALVRAAPRGPAALQQATIRAPEGALLGLKRISVQIDSRLQGNQETLRRGLDARRGTQQRGRDETQTQFEQALGVQTTLAGTELDAAAAGFVGAFGALAGTVSKSAAAWSQPLAQRMARSIDAKRKDAAAALKQTLTGEKAKDSAPPGGKGGAGKGEGKGAGKAPGAAPSACGACEPAAGAAAKTPGPTAGPAAPGAKASGLNDEAQHEIEMLNERLDPPKLFGKQIESTAAQVRKQIDDRATKVTGAFSGGFAGTVDETGVVAAVRGVSQARGRALEQVSYPAASGGRALDPDLVKNLGADSTEYAAARAWLRGDPVEAARLELKDSLGFFNDDEARIEAVMRALSPEQAKALGAQHGDVVAEVKDALDGTDAKVFDALKTGDQVTADALRLKDEADEARRDGDDAARNRAIEARTGVGDDSDARAVADEDTAERRKAVVAALGGLVADSDLAGVGDSAAVAKLSAEDRAVAYVTRDIEVYVGGGGEGGGEFVTMKLEGAHKDLTVALLKEGGDSDNARAARIGVSLQSDKDFDPENFDRATFDAGFSKDPKTPEERAAHQRAAEQRARVVLLAAQKYAGDPPGTPAAAGAAAVPASAPSADAGAGKGASAPKPETPPGAAPGTAPAATPGTAGAPSSAPAAAAAPDPGAAMNDPKVLAARDRLIAKLNDKLGAGSLDAQLAAGLITDARPSPATCAIAMDHAMHAHWGTNEALLFRFTERMDRDEIAAMRTAYKTRTGNSLDAELGVYGEGGTFTELSGDDRLKMERLMMGVPRNDQEKLESAAFALQQQRREAGGLGSSLAEDTYADQAMRATERRLERLAGGPIQLNRRGELTASLRNFDGSKFTGADRAEFESATEIAQAVAENYGKRIDAFADVFTTGIAILGAIAAAAITVATGGAAAPLIAAAIVTGLASMSANYVIKGGHYGWEQAGIDLAMTAVQALTAGVGAQLGQAAQVASKGAQAAATASRTLATLSKLFTGNPIVDQIIVGAITGGIGGLGNAALNEQTWSGSGGDAVLGLLGGLVKGSLAGGATAAVTSSIEALARNAPMLREQAQKLASGGALSRVAGVGVKGASKLGGAIGAGLNASSEGGLVRGGLGVVGRGVTRAGLSAVGGMTGRATELAFDKASGKFKGDAGDALVEIGHTGLHSLVQGFGEGGAEAFGQGVHNQRVQASGVRINAERQAKGLKPLEGHALEAAVDDLHFLDRHGRQGGDSLGRAVNLDHVATHGGLAPAPGDIPARPHGGEAGTAAPHGGEIDAAGPHSAPPAAEPAAARSALQADEGGLPHLAAPAEARAAPAAMPVDAEPHLATSSAAPDRDPAPAAGTTHAADRAADATADRAAAAAPEHAPGHAPDHDAEALSRAIDHAIDHAEGGPAMRVGADQPGADVRTPRPPESSEATLLQRQRAGALHEQADALAQRAGGLLDRAIAAEAQAALADAHNPRRAGALREEATRLLDQAVALEAQAAQHRTDAAEFASGRRSATADLPGPDDVDAMFAGLAAERPGLVRVPLSDLERNPALLPRMIRPLLEGEGGGRLVFRVESERSRALVHVDAHGNVHVEGGASAHLNFGSFERAMEFVLNNSQGKARIIRFEVDEAWVRALRSAAIPEHGTVDLHGQPRLVDVRFADDQMEIPAGLIGELNRMVVPGSGRVHEVAAPGGGGGATPPAPNPLLPHDGTAAAIPGSRMQLAGEPVIQHPLNALSAAVGEAFGIASVGPLAAHPAPEGQMRLAMTDAEGRTMTVRLEVAATEGGAVASFTRNPHGDDPMYLVRLSPFAPLESHGRAIAHELTEVRHHATDGGAADALRSGAAPAERLSAHDRGRLGELEVLARRLAAVPEGDAVGRARVHDDIDALAAHLGLLQARAADPRLALALAALPEASPARTALADAQQRARRTGDADLLQPGRVPSDAAVPSAADRARLAELEGLLRRLPPKPADGGAEPAAVLALRHAAEVQAAALGLAFGQHAPQRARLAEALLGEPHLLAALAEVRRGALANPFLKPMTGSPVDVPTLLRQIELATAMGEGTRAAALAQVAGLHLEQSGQLGLPLAALQPELQAPALRALLADVVERHTARLREPTLRAEAEALRAKLAELPPPHPVADGVQRQRSELEARIRVLLAEADAAGRIALRSQGDTADAARRGDTGVTLAARVDALPEVFNDRANAQLVRQQFADSPSFQGFAEFMAAHREANLGRRFSDIGAGRKGTVDAMTLNRAQSLEIALLHWTTGHYVDPQTGEFNRLGDLVFLKPHSGSTPSFPAGHPALASTDLVEVAVRAAGPLRLDEVPIKHIVEMTPAEAAAHRKALLARRDAMEVEMASHPEGSPAYREAEAIWSRAMGDLGRTSEGLGVAAGVKVAAALDGGPMTPEAIPRAGAGVPDLAYRDASGALVVIECKGPTAGLVDRAAEQGSMPVRAQQGTPEYLTSLATEMARSSDPQIKKLGLAILAEMPNVRYLVVRQTADASGQLGPITVKAFDMKEPGR